MMSQCAELNYVMLKLNDVSVLDDVAPPQGTS